MVLNNAGGPVGHQGDSADSAPGIFGPDSGFTPGHTLPPGQQLRDYRIDAVLGEGGFGIVYLAMDMALQRHVAIKEYMPSAMASRASASLTVIVKSANHAETFAAGLRSFVNEARLLARFDHPALVKVHQFWEQNGTAYMVMPYYEGPTLKRTLADLRRPPTEGEVRRWLMPLLDALAVLHAERCYHRDIAPDNILITANGPLLLDFGAARRVIGDMTQALTAVLKPGFAPIEQYGDVPGMSQGAWTDIFALASVLYVALAGVKPVSSIERVMEDRLRPLSKVAAGRASASFLQAVDDALALRPADRPQTVAEFRARLDGRGSTAGYSAAAPGPAQTSERTIVAAAPDAPVAALERTLVVDIGFEPFETAAMDGAGAKVPGAAAVPAPAPAPEPAPVAAADRRRVLVLAVTGAAVLTSVAAWQWAIRRGEVDGAGRTASEPAATPPEVPPAVGGMVPVLPSASASAPAAAAAPSPLPSPARETTPPFQLPQPAPAPTPATATAGSPTAPPRQSAPIKAVPRVDKQAPAERPTDQRKPAATQARCSDILQKASLEPITASEAEFLKRECR